MDALAITGITARELGLLLARLKVGLAADWRALLDYREVLVCRPWRHGAEIVEVDRYPDLDAFVSAYGTAPLAESSSRIVRHRLDRGSNRELNCPLHGRDHPDPHESTAGRAYYDRERAEGNTSRGAVR